MVPSSLRRSLRTLEPNIILTRIPTHFCLNKGHVSFFYNKLTFLQKRFLKLAKEMERRGYTPDYSRLSYFDGFDSHWYQDWRATSFDNELVMHRINTRIQEKPYLYT